MAEPYFHRNVKVIIHDEARQNDCKVASLMSHAIAQASICIVTDVGRQSAGATIGKDYPKIWRSLRSFNDLDLPLWIEVQTGPDAKIGCLIAKAGNGDPTFFMRRFTMKHEAVVQSISPVFMGWSHSSILEAKKPLAVSNFVKVQHIRQDQQSLNEFIPDTVRNNALLTAALMLGVMTDMLSDGAGSNKNLIRLKNPSLLADDQVIMPVAGPEDFGQIEMELA